MKQIDKKRIAKNTIMLYIRMILIMAVSLYTSRIVLECLGVADFGVYNVVGGIVVMFGFINSAMSVATQRFLSFEIGKDNHSRLQVVFSTSLSIHFAIALIIILFAETFGLWFLNNKMNISVERIFAANCVYQCSIISLFITIMSVPYNALIVAHERMSAFAYISILEVILKLLSAYLLFIISGDKLIIYAILMLIISGIVRLVYQIYCRSKFSESKYIFVYDKVLLSSILSFSAWSLFGGIAYVAKNQGVNVVLNIFFGSIINAAWSIAQQVNSALLSLIMNFSTAINPPIIKAYSCNDVENTNMLLFSGMKYSFFLSICIIVPLFTNCSYVLDIWLDNVPSNSVLFTKLTLLVLIIESIVHPISAAVQATGHIKMYQSIIGTMLFLNLPISYLALKLGFSSSSVLYIAIVLSLVSVFARFIILFTLIDFPCSKMYKLLRIIVSILIFNIVLYYTILLLPETFMYLVINSFVIVLLNCLMFYFIGLENKEKRFVKDKFLSIINK